MRRGACSRRGHRIGPLVALLSILLAVGAAPANTVDDADWYVRSDKLTVPGKAGFGSSLASSSDGSTLLVGAPGRGGFHYAWIYNWRNGHWSSTRIGRFSGNFGFSVALTRDGKWALIGRPAANEAWFYRRTDGGTWVGSKVTALGRDGDSHFGYSVAFSPDGTKAIIGGPYDNHSSLPFSTGFGKGAAWLSSALARVGDNSAAS